MSLLEESSPRAMAGFKKKSHPIFLHRDVMLGSRCNPSPDRDKRVILFITGAQRGKAKTVRVQEQKKMAHNPCDKECGKSA